MTHRRTFSLFFGLLALLFSPASFTQSFAQHTMQEPPEALIALPQSPASFFIYDPKNPTQKAWGHAHESYLESTTLNTTTNQFISSTLFLDASLDKAHLTFNQLKVDCPLLTPCHWSYRIQSLNTPTKTQALCIKDTHYTANGSTAQICPQQAHTIIQALREGASVAFLVEGKTIKRQTVVPALFTFNKVNQKVFIDKDPLKY